MGNKKVIYCVFELILLVTRLVWSVHHLCQMLCLYCTIQLHGVANETPSVSEMHVFEGEKQDCNFNEKQLNRHKGHVAFLLR